MKFCEFPQNPKNWKLPKSLTQKSKVRNLKIPEIDKSKMQKRNKITEKKNTRKHQPPSLLSKNP